MPIQSMGDIKNVKQDHVSQGIYVLTNKYKHRRKSRRMRGMAKMGCFCVSESVLEESCVIKQDEKVISKNKHL